MDVELENRDALIKSLGDSFHCYEECQLRHAVHRENRIRADVVAFTKLADKDVAFAFEVKVPNAKWELKNWLSAFKQASDYVDAVFCDERISSQLKRAPILCSFVFPAPNFRPWAEGDTSEDRHMREYELENVRGAMLLAQHFMVGISEKETSGKLRLKLGTDTIWRSGEGFRPKALPRLYHRRVGSKAVGFLDNDGSK